MKKGLMIMGLALCSTLAFAQTTNRTNLNIAHKSVPQVAAKPLVDYKASIFTKDDDTLRLFQFAANDMTGITYGASAVLGATDVVDGQAVGAANAHGQTSSAVVWQRINDSIAIYSSNFEQTYQQTYSWIRNNAAVFGGEYVVNNGFMLMDMYEVGTAVGAINAYIELPAVPREGAQVIDVALTQIYMCFNSDRCYIDYQIGGQWKSREINVRGVDVANQDWAAVRATYTMPFELAQEDNIKLRIRWASNDAAGGCYGYFWTVDDIAIVSGSETRVKRYDQSYIDGAYGTMPLGMKIPLSWYAQVANTGINDINNAVITLRHVAVDDTLFRPVAQFPQTGLTLLHGDPTALNYVSINERTFLDSINNGRWWGKGAWDLGGHYADTTYVPQNYFGMPVEDEGLQYIQTIITSESDAFDTIAWPYYSYIVVDNAQHGNINGSLWAHDNGVICNRTSFHYGYLPYGDEYMITSDTNHYQQANYMLALRYTTGSEIPVDANGEPWALLGLEIVPSTNPNDMQYMNNSEIYPVVMTADYEGGWISRTNTVVTGTSSTRPYVVTDNDINDEDLIVPNGGDVYKSVIINFPEQPTLQANTSYYLGYQMANNGYFCPATTSYRYYDNTNAEWQYLSQDRRYYPYARYFTPDMFDVLLLDPIANTYQATMALNMDEYPLIRAIVGPKQELERYEVQADCLDGDSNLVVIFDEERHNICNLESGSITYNQGSSFVVYVYPNDDEHYYIDSIVINDVPYSPNDQASWPEDVYIEAHQVNVMNPEDTTQVALWRNAYIVSFEEMSEDKIISAVAHWEPWHIGIDPVAANVALGVQPNPATSQVRVSVSGVSGVVNCSIIDMSGRVVYSNDINAEQAHTIDLSSFARGAYFVRVTNNTFSKIEKLIVR